MTQSPQADQRPSDLSPISGFHAVGVLGAKHRWSPFSKALSWRWMPSSSCSLS